MTVPGGSAASDPTFTKGIRIVLPCRARGSRVAHARVRAPRFRTSRLLLTRRCLVFGFLALALGDDRPARLHRADAFAGDGFHFLDYVEPLLSAFHVTLRIGRALNMRDLLQPMHLLLIALVFILFFGGKKLA